jgi:hypothetical protein
VQSSVLLGSKLLNEQLKDLTWLVVLFHFRPQADTLERQINVTSDIGAMSEAVAKHLAVATGI